MTNKKIIKNVLKMFMYRRLIEEKDIKQILSNINVKDNEIVIKTKKNNYIIYITDEIQSINKNPEIIKLLKKNEDYNKIIICDKFEKKIIDQLNQYKNIEIFTKEYIILNILEHNLQPEFQFIDEKELENLNIKKNQFPRMLSTDPVAKYLNLKSGDIIKVIGRNENSMYDPYYNIVV
jgi:DNA-directed RNA polymerase subunit H (RpoH/RPB5)